MADDTVELSLRKLGKTRLLRGNVIRVKDADGLLPKERMFVEEYLVSMNATSAAVLAGYSVKTADAIGAQVLKKPHVARVLEIAKKARLERLRIRQDEALLELRGLVTSDLDHYRRQGNRVVTRDGVEPLRNEDDTVTIPRTRALSGIKIKSRTYKDEDGTEVTEHEMDLKVHSKTAALDMYMKHLGMFPTAATRLEIEDSEGNTLVIQEVIE